MNPKFEPVMTPGRPAPAPMPRAAETLPVDRHRVLRNTYWLLAISLLPVVAGAWLGMQLNFASLFKAAPILAPLRLTAAVSDNSGCSWRASCTRRMARSRNSWGYFLGAGMV